MKLNKLTAAMAATVVATASHAQIESIDTTTGSAAAVSAVAVVGNATIVDGLRTLQGITDCAGSTDVACSPTISSAELRAIISNASNGANDITNADGDDLQTAAGLSTKTGGFAEHATANTNAALSSFMGTGVVAGFPCGQGAAINITNAGQATDAATQAAVAAVGAGIGFIHATSLDSSLAFLKLDGVAPSAAALASSNYNLVANLATDPALSTSANGITAETVAAVAGVASHSPAACSPLTPGGAIADVSGGSI